MLYVDGPALKKPTSRSCMMTCIKINHYIYLGLMTLPNELSRQLRHKHEKVNKITGCIKSLNQCNQYNIIMHTLTPALTYSATATTCVLNEGQM